MVIIVQSCKGRDIGRYYVVIEEDDHFYYLADGEKRGINYTKKKRKKHTKYQDSLSFERATWITNNSQRPIDVKNAEIRKTLKQWKQEKEK